MGKKVVSLLFHSYFLKVSTCNDDVLKGKKRKNKYDKYNDDILLIRWNF